MSVKHLLLAASVLLFLALAACSLGDSSGTNEAVGWLFVVANLVGAAATFHLGRVSDGLVREFSGLLSLALVALACAYASYRVFPLLDGPAFGDALWCTAYAILFAAGVKGAKVLATLTFRDARIDVLASVVAGLAATTAMHFLVGLPALSDHATDGQMAAYQTGLLMMAIGMSMGALYLVLAYRSAGGEYASLLGFTMAFVLLAAAADFVYGMIHPAIASGISPASTLTPQGDASDWLRMGSQVMILLMVVWRLQAQERPAPGAHVADSSARTPA